MATNSIPDMSDFYSLSQIVVEKIHSWVSGVIKALEISGYFDISTQACKKNSTINIFNACAKAWFQMANVMIL